MKIIERVSASNHIIRINDRWLSLEEEAIVSPKPSRSLMTGKFIEDSVFEELFTLRVEITKELVGNILEEKLNIPRDSYNIEFKEHKDKITVNLFFYSDCEQLCYKTIHRVCSAETNITEFEGRYFIYTQCLSEMVSSISEINKETYDNLLELVRV